MHAQHTSSQSLFQKIQTAFTATLADPAGKPRLALDRRSFLKLSAAASGFTLVGYTSLAAATQTDFEGAGDTLMLNAFVHISPTGAITLYSHTPEMGQGTKTSIPMMIAEELGAKWSDVIIQQAPVNPAVYGEQRAGGSTSTPRNWKPMREVGAAARQMFIAAAAKQWGVAVSECKTSQSQVIHQPSGKTLSFGALALKAAQQPAPKKDQLTFKARSEYELLGKPISGVDNPAIVTGKPLFGVDVRLPNMLHAVYEKCPEPYGKVKSANVDEIKKLPGIVDAFIVQGNGDVNELLDGVAIVAKTSWQAVSARQKLKVEWDLADACTDSWQAMQQQAQQLAQTKGEKEIIAAGDVAQQFSDANNKVLESFYTHPYVAHACMEPMNCTAHYQPAANGKPETMSVWAPTQAPARIFGMVTKHFGIPEANITVHQTRMGGAFGRRGRTDFSCEAATISHRVKAPVNLTWSREDDMMHDFYRAGGFYNLKGAVDAKGKLVALENHLIGPGFEGQPTTGTRQTRDEFPAPCIANYRGTLSLIDSKTPCGPWRAPGSNVTAWAVQSFIAEMAHLANRDHLEFLLEIMGEPRWTQPGVERALHTGRAAGVIKLAAEKAGWGKPLPLGHGLGLAFYVSHAGHVAEVAEVSVDANKKVTVHKITAAADIGFIMNMSGATAQVEGSIMDGLSTMMNLQITIEKGRVQQNNFHSYGPMRIAQAPKVEVHFIQSEFDPTGIGEPALPPIAPAIGNAIFAATGVRVREMPLRLSGYSLA